MAMTSVNDTGWINPRVLRQDRPRCAALYVRLPVFQGHGVAIATLPMPAHWLPVGRVIGLPLVIWNGSGGFGTLQPRLRSPIRTPVVPLASGCALSGCVPSHLGSRAAWERMNGQADRRAGR